LIHGSITLNQNKKKKPLRRFAASIKWLEIGNFILAYGRNIERKPTQQSYRKYARTSNEAHKQIEKTQRPDENNK
jgi:hypothetical protein